MAMKNFDFEEALAKAVPSMKLTTGIDAEFAKAQLNAIYGKSNIEMKIENKLAEEEEWIWVEGYKGTEQDMTCRGYQFALGGQTDMPTNIPIELCQSGFHFCLKLSDVFRYYDIGKNNRFFKVRALVRKSDYESYGTSSGLFNFGNKLTSKSIIFLSELTLDEIFAGATYKDWTEEEKRLALKHSVGYVKNMRAIAELMGYGYSEPFANWLVNHSKYEIAKAVGSQTDLSMDMKCLAIFK